MDGGEAYSPIDRRMYPSLFAVRDLAVLKAWLFLSHGQPDKGHLPLLYRIDAAKARTVHEKIPPGASVHTKTPKPLKLFPPLERFFRRAISVRAPPKLHGGTGTSGEFPQSRFCPRPPSPGGSPGIASARQVACS
jgi:hypothetical protein